MSTVLVNGVNLYYEQEGNGPPLLCIAGYRSDVSSWALVRKQLSKHFTLYMIDNRGSGRSDCPDSPYTIETMADDAKGFIESLQLKKPIVIGHSMGGAIAQALAYKYPQLIEKLILVNAPIRFRAPSAFTLGYFLKLQSEGLPSILLVEGAMPWLFSSTFLKNSKQVSDFLELAKIYSFSPTLVGQKRHLEALKQFDSTSWYKKIIVPTLVIEGREDIICPEDSKILGEGIPKAQLVTFHDQAHMAHLEKPELLAQTIIKFGAI
jgi:pimeloyl-ACP methyl ester carboxylesterase